MDSQDQFDAFTEQGYRRLLNRLRDAGYAAAGFQDSPSGRHALLRHDVDVSPQRALRLAQIEAEEGIRSTFFMMTRSRFYNLAEPAVSSIVRNIRALGHTIGLHFDGEVFNRDVWRLETLDAAIRGEKVLIEAIVDGPIEVVTYHNPDQSNLLEFRGVTIGGLINGYSERLKEHYRYCSDSNGYWRFQPMLDVIAEGHERLYLLTHPEWWTRPLSPSDRIDRAIDGRARANRDYYDRFLIQAGRQNVGRVK